VIVLELMSTVGGWTSASLIRYVVGPHHPGSRLLVAGVRLCEHNGVICRPSCPWPNRCWNRWAART
jgi:hypothetical protein